MRTLAGEYGQVFPVGVAKFRAQFDEWIKDGNNSLAG